MRDTSRPLLVIAAVMIQMRNKLFKKILLILGFIGLACSIYPIGILFYYLGLYFLEHDNPYRYEYMMGVFEGIYWGFPILLLSSIFALFGVKKVKSKLFACFYVPTILSAIPYIYFVLWEWIYYFYKTKIIS